MKNEFNKKNLTTEHGFKSLFSIMMNVTPVFVVESH